MEKVYVSILNTLGDEPLELTPEEAERLIFASQGRYFVVDEGTRALLKEVSLKPGQRIALIPIAMGG
jgi:hypothetical protein